jgi:hypothetical protein
VTFFDKGFNLVHGWQSRPPLTAVTRQNKENPNNFRPSRHPSNVSRKKERRLRDTRA